MELNSNSTEDSICYSSYFTRSCPQASSQASQTTDTQANIIKSPSQYGRKKIYVTTEAFNSAKDLLLALPQVESESAEEYAKSREIILKTNVSLDSYLQYHDSRPNLPVRIYLDNGTIKAYEVPNTPHSTATATIVGLLFAWDHQNLRYGTDATLILDRNSSKEPNSWIKPKKRNQPLPGAVADNLGNPYPSMIIEVGNIQSLPDLHRKVALYFSARTTIQIVLVIKIFQPSVNNTLTLIATKYLRTSPTPLIPVEIISFGTASPERATLNYITNTMGVSLNNIIGVGLIDPITGNNYPACNMAGIRTYIVNIPGSELFDRDPTLHPLTTAMFCGFDLDLFLVQDEVRGEYGI